MTRVLGWVGHGCVIIGLTLVTQIGGLAWLASRAFHRKVLAFVVLYGLGWGAAVLLAPVFGRDPLPCTGAPLRMQSVGYCVTLRHFATPELKSVATEAAAEVARRYPGTVTLALDASFPFFDGFPLLPHLSHDDGEKIDFAFYYGRAGRYLPGRTRSPIGYWAFENPSDDRCPRAWPTLRWDLSWLQPFWAQMHPELDRVHALVWQLAEDPRVGKIFLEPLKAYHDLPSHAKIRFQGCRASRHDDHIHVQL